MADPSITLDGVTYRVTPEYLASAALDAKNTAAQISEQLAELKKYVNSLEAAWGGIAHDEFVLLMIEYDRLAKLLHDALYGIGDRLQTSFGRYVRAEGINIKNIDDIKSGLPGASTVPANLD